MPDALPLAGIRVLDLTQIYNGPYATFLMAMAGAEVIKVEPPGGEYLRRRDSSSGAAMPFAMLNACKESMSLNLKSERGREIFLDLVATADVVAENFSPGTMDRLCLGWEVLRAANPSVIFASGSGYGQEGGYRDMMAMDLTVQAMSGIMSVTGHADGPPMKSGAAVCDFSGGIHLYGAILTALFERTRTGEGVRVDVSMMEAVYMSMASNIGMRYGARADTPLRTGNRHGGLSICPYNVYPAREGFIAIICNTDRHWAALARVLNRADLIDAPDAATTGARVANMDWIDGIIADITKGRDARDLARALGAARVPHAVVRDLPEVLDDEVLHERGFLTRVEHPDFGPVSLPTSPLRMGGAAQAAYRPSPPYARDTARILDEVGLDAKGLGALREEGVI